MSLDFNVAPYFDDYSATNNFYKILFQPGRPVQTRELNQLQTILQEQVSRFGNHIFKNGTMVIPGHLYYDNNVSYVKLNQINEDGTAASAFLDESIIGVTLEGALALGETQGVTAVVIAYTLATDTDPATLFVRYVSGSTLGKSTFESNQVITWSDGKFNVATSLDGSHQGKAVICSIGDGVYYVNGSFVNVEKQTIVVSKYSSAPTTRIGLNVVETVVTETSDPTLYDNSLGYPNYGAPGAHRYKIELLLETRTVGTSDYETANIEKFIDLMQVKDGNIVYNNNYTQYAELMKMIAHRTYDESGDYEIEPFDVTAVEYRSNERGAWAAQTPYLRGDVVTTSTNTLIALTDGVSNNSEPIVLSNYKATDGTITWGLAPKFYAVNAGSYKVAGGTLTEELDLASKYIYKVSPGRAYVKGYEVNKQSDSMVVANKALSFESIVDEAMSNLSGSFVELQNVVGIPRIGACEEVDIYFLSRTDIAGYASLKQTATVSSYNGSVAVINNRGFGYDRNNPPTVTSTGGGVFRAIINSASQLQEIQIITAGTTPATMTIADPPSTALKIGTCKVRSINYLIDSATEQITSNTHFRTEVFDVKLFDGFKWDLHARSLASADGIFAGDISTTTVVLPGNATVANGDASVSGAGTNFLNALSVGQSFVVAPLGTGSSFTGIVGYDAAMSDIAFEATANSGVTTITGGTIAAVYSNFVSSGMLIQPLNKNCVRKIRSVGDAVNNISYSVRRRLTITGSSGSVTLSVPGETFVKDNLNQNYIVSKLISSTWSTLVPGDYTLSVSNDGLSLTVGGVSGSPSSLAIMATINKTGAAAQEKIKTPVYTYLDIQDKTTLDKLTYSLGKPDVYQIIEVKKMNGAGTLSGSNYGAFNVNATDLVDITKDFKLNSGQTPFYYGISSVTYTAKKAPDNTIRIVFAYFKHSPGDYFCIDSYQSVPYANISPLLRDSLDFRPTVADDGTFNINSADITDPVCFDSLITFDYSVYLPRRDVVYLTHENNEFKYIQGTASSMLPEVVIPTDAMGVAEVIVMPGDVNPVAHQIRKTPHNRYTMADIGRLDKRLQNVEYYTQLSLLEKQTVDQRIVDENGFDRFKLGVLTDQFQDYSAADTSDPEYIASIDPEQQELRPMFLQEDMKLREVNTNDTQRISDNYTVHGNGIVTLRYNTVPFISQPVATRTEFINPYAVISFEGSITLFPKTDQWKEFQIGNAYTITGYSPNYIGEVGTLIGSVTWNNWSATWKSSWGGRTGKFSNSGAFSQSEARTLFDLRTSFTTDSWSNWDTLYNGLGNNAWWLRAVTNNLPRAVTANVNVTATRTGTQAFVKENKAIYEAVSTSIGSFVDAVYMRQRPIIMSTTGLSPVTDLDFYIDSVKLTAVERIQPAVIIDIAATSAVINTIEENWSDPTETTTQRFVLLNSNLFYLDKGSVITQNGSSAIVAKKVTITTGIRLYCVNTSGSFISGTAAIKNGESSTNVTVSSVAQMTYATDSLGNWAGVLNFPNSINERFKTGVVDIRICKANDDYATSLVKANANYFSTGEIEILDTLYKVTYESVIGSKTVTDSFSTNSTLAYDPLAQTFSVSKSAYPQGVFCTGVDIFIAEKDPVRSLTVQIRPVVNGYPSSTEYITEQTIWPDQITASSTFSLSKNTTVKFKSPVYLEADKEYALVLLSPSSTKYKSWIARMGERKIGYDQILTEQPDTTAIGSLFKSQNGTTWEPSQYEDLTFILHKAEFVTSMNGQVGFVNSEPTTRLLAPNSMTAVNGLTVVRVTAPNHGCVVGDLVKIKFYRPANYFLTPYNTAGEITSTFEVTRANVDTFEFNMPTACSAGANSGVHVVFGGDNIEVSKQHIFSVMYPAIDVTKFDKTDVTLTMKTTSLVNTDNIVVDGLTVYEKHLSDPFTVHNKENVHFDNPQQVMNSLQVDGNNVAYGKTMQLFVTMNTANKDISPLFDVERVSVFMVRNIINDPIANVSSDFDILNSPTMVASFVYNAAGESYIEVVYSDQGGNGGAVFSAIDAMLPGMLVECTAGANINTIFTVLSKTLTVGTKYRVYVKVDSLYNNGATTFLNKVSESGVTFKTYAGYIEEFAAEKTSVIATHLTTPINLQDSATSLRVQADMNLPGSTIVDVYYRTSISNDFTPFNTKQWVKMTPSPAPTNVNNFSQFIEETYIVEGLPEFMHAQIKMVMRSNNEAYVPRVKNLRIMALA